MHLHNSIYIYAVYIVYSIWSCYLYHRKIAAEAQVGVNVIVPIVVLHELDTISRRGAGAVAAVDATKAAAAALRPELSAALPHRATLLLGPGTE